MDEIEKLIKMLESPKASVRYDACESLRVAPSLNDAAIAALERASKDLDPDVRDAAQGALSLHKSTTPPLDDIQEEDVGKTPKQYLEQASASKEQGELERALEQCDAALQLDPTLAEAYNLRGTILAAWAREDEAILAFREALRIDPDFAAARENLLAAEAELEAYGVSPPPETLQCIGRTQGRRCPHQPIYKCQTCDALLCYEHANFFRSPATGQEQSEQMGIYCPAHYRQAVAEHNAQAKGRRGAQASQPLCERGNGEECLTYSGFDCGLEVCKLCGQGSC